MPPEPSGRLIIGLQPVREALRRHGPRVLRVIVQSGTQPRLEALARYAQDLGVAVERAGRPLLDRLSQGGTHQGALAWAPELELTPFSRLLTEPNLLAVALDGIQDPQNFGAVVRSAVALGHAAVIWGEHASAPLTPATFRASAGAVEHATLCRVPSLHGALHEAATTGVQVVGLDARAPTQLSSVDLTAPTLLVIGNEHEGMKRAVRRACSLTAHLVPPGPVESLNASVAAAVSLYEARIQRIKSTAYQASADVSPEHTPES
ncbi:MAG TPA: RNA methyltransferase [Polyangiaceae bacterium]|nr:RNA methyltransferase [Polyangiaceae bacterium]